MATAVTACRALRRYRTGRRRRSRRRQRHCCPVVACCRAGPYCRTSITSSSTNRGNAISTNRGSGDGGGGCSSGCAQLAQERRQHIFTAAVAASCYCHLLHPLLQPLHTAQPIERQQQHLLLFLARPYFCYSQARLNLLWRRL